MGGSKQQSNQIKLLVWMDGTITVNTSDALTPLLVFLQGLRGVKYEPKWQTNSMDSRVAISIWNYVAKGCYCERLLTTAPNNSHGGQAAANGAKITKDGEEKSVRVVPFFDTKYIDYNISALFRDYVQKGKPAPVRAQSRHGVRV